MNQKCLTLIKPFYSEQSTHQDVAEVKQDMLCNSIVLSLSVVKQLKHIPAPPGWSLAPLFSIRNNDKMKKILF